MKMLAQLILWIVLPLEVWTQGVARLQKHGNPSSQLLPGADWWDGWFAIYASKPSGNVNWMLRGATDLPLLSRHGDEDNGPISTLQPFAGQPWLPSNPGKHDHCNWRWMRYINPRNWHYQTRTTSIFSRLDPCKTQPSMSQMRTAARTMLHRRFHNELGLRSWPHQALLTALEKTMSGLSYRRYQHATLRLLCEEGRGEWWHYMAQARRPLDTIPSP